MLEDEGAEWEKLDEYEALSLKSMYSVCAYTCMYMYVYVYVWLHVFQ